MTEINYEVWKEKELAEKFLTGVRGAIPFANGCETLAIAMLTATSKYLSLHCLEEGNLGNL